MKSILKSIIFTSLLVFAQQVAFAQDADKTVTLVVSGQGKTQDEAKQNALRSAIEQAFGTFISSKTEILNDNLVKDEIVSVANGNIQKFEIISEVQIPDGGYATSLKATVSVTKLTSFVESKGVVVEFKGSLLAANVKQQMLNEQNEIKSISNIASTCKEILDLSCDFEIVRGGPKQKGNDNNKWAVPLKINVKFNDNIEQFNQYFLNSITGLCMSADEVFDYKSLGKEIYPIAIGGGSLSGATGITNNFNVLKSVAQTNSNLSYKIIDVSGGVLYKSDNISLIEKELKKIMKTPSKEMLSVVYSEKSIKNIFYFRSEKTIISIIDLIFYTRHSVLNFQISNGIDTNISVYSKGPNDFELRNNTLTPIMMTIRQGDDFSPKGIFNYSNSNIYRPILYKKVEKYDRPCFMDFSPPYIPKFRAELDRTLYLKKYTFHILAKYVSKEFFKAVISLYDFQASNMSVIDLYFEDILTLTELDRVQGYTIKLVSKK